MPEEHMWSVVAEFPLPMSDTTLSQIASEVGGRPDVLRLQGAGQVRAVMLPLQEMLSASPPWRLVGSDAVTSPGQQLLLTSDFSQRRELESLLEELQTIDCRPSLLTLIDTDPLTSQVILSPGSGPLMTCGSLVGRLKAGPVSLPLYQLSSVLQQNEDDTTGPPIPSGPQTIPEEPGNLQQRSRWFERRTGRRE